MRLFAVHDSEGRILEMVMCPSGAVVPIPETSPGLVFTEIEPPESVTEGMDLQDFAKTHRVTAMTQQKSPVLRLEEPPTE